MSESPPFYNLGAFAQIVGVQFSGTWFGIEVNPVPGVSGPAPKNVTATVGFEGVHGPQVKFGTIPPGITTLPTGVHDISVKGDYTIVASDLKNVFAVGGDGSPVKGFGIFAFTSLFGPWTVLVLQAGAAVGGSLVTATVNFSAQGNIDHTVVTGYVYKKGAIVAGAKTWHDTSKLASASAVQSVPGGMDTLNIRFDLTQGTVVFVQ